MGRAYKRGNNWAIDYLTPEGVRKREIVGPNKSIAEKVLQKRLVLMAENKHLDVRRNAKVKLSDMVDKYIEMYLKPNRPTWWKSEKNNLRHLLNFFGQKHLHEITTLNIEEFRQERLKSVGKNSVNKNVACLRAMYNKAIEWGLFHGINPASKIKMFKFDSKRTRYLEREEISRLLSNCNGHLKDIVEFAINTGMRQGEIFHLKWRDINFNTGIIYALQTKTNEIKEIPMNENVRNVLVRVRKDPESSYVFPSKDGKPFDNVKKSFKTALIKSGIENFRFHDLRHTFASHLVMSGVDLLTVKELLGHKDLKMTLRYAHLSCNHKVQAVKALDSLNGTNKAQSGSHDTLSTLNSNTYELMESGFQPEGRAK